MTARWILLAVVLISLDFWGVYGALDPAAGLSDGGVASVQRRKPSRDRDQPKNKPQKQYQYQNQYKPEYSAEYSQPQFEAYEGAADDYGGTTKQQDRYHKVDPHPDVEPDPALKEDPNVYPYPRGKAKTLDQK